MTAFGPVFGWNSGWLAGVEPSAADAAPIEILATPSAVKSFRAASRMP